MPGLWTTKGGSTGKKSEGARQDTVEWEAGKGYLLDKVELGTGAESEGKFPVGAPTTVRLATNVSQGEVFNAKKEAEKVPIFRYYEYAGSSSTNTGAAASTLKEIPIAVGKELGKTEAEKVASVEVRFKTGSYTKEIKVSKSEESTIPSELLTQTTFAFSAPNSEATIEAGPCE